MPPNWCWSALLLLVGLVWLVWIGWRRQHAQGRTAVVAQVQRLLKPRTPDDCPICRQQTTSLASTIPLRPPVPPWREVKSRRGAMGRINTHGFACPNTTCLYYQITDAQVHAPLWRRR